MGSDKTKLRWHGHACFEIQWGISLITDPHDGKSIGIKSPNAKADIILVSHDHFDHNKVGSVSSQNTKIVNKAGEHEVDGLTIVGLPTYHDENHGSKRGENIVYKFDVEDVRFCHLGDLGHIPGPDTIEKLGQVDVLFVPVGGVFTLDADNAWKTVKALSPKVVVPMHYRVGGLSLSIQPLNPFIERTSEDAIVHVGNEIDFDREDIPEDMEVWVFTL